MRWFTFTQERFWRTRDSVSPKTKRTQKRMKNKSLFNLVAVQHFYKCTNWVKPFTTGGNPTEYKDGTDPLICAGTLKWSAGSLACKRHDLLLHKQNRKHLFYWRLPHTQLKTPMNKTEKKGLIYCRVKKKRICPIRNIFSVTWFLAWANGVLSYIMTFVQLSFNIY